MAPAGMEGDVEGGIGLADRRHDLVGAGLEPVEIDREMLEAAVETGLQKLMRPLPHRGGGQEAQGGLCVSEDRSGWSVTQGSGSL